MVGHDEEQEEALSGEQLEKDQEALAIMANSLGEEYKHFSMELEFLLRKKPEWRAIARGILFKDGDIVDNGEAAEESATEGGGDSGGGSAGPAGSLGIGSLKGRAS